MIKEFDFSEIGRDRPLALFLDIDGTMIEFAPTPDEVIVPPELSGILARLSEESEGGLAIITGRGIESADRLFRPIEFPMAGLHGGEFRFDGTHEMVPAPVAPECWREEARELTRRFPGVRYEEKRFAFSLHYRENPEYGPGIIAAMNEMLSHDNPGFHLLMASMAVEVRPDGIDKGSAIQRFMRLPEFAGRHPIFFGDDTTDEDGFRAMREIGGTPVVVGPRRPPEVEFYVKDPRTMRGLLAGLTLQA